MEDADAAVAEAYRVLRPGGHFVFTVWHGPEQGGELYALVMGAVEEHGSFEVDLPPAPPMFRFSDPEASRRALQAAGFEEISSRALALEWRPESADAVLEMLYKGLVRMPMILQAQTEPARARIHAAVVAGAESLRREDGIRVAFPAALVSATRPG